MVKAVCSNAVCVLGFSMHCDDFPTHTGGPLKYQHHIWIQNTSGVFEVPASVRTLICVILWYLSNSEMQPSVSLVKGLVWIHMFLLDLFIWCRPSTSYEPLPWYIIYIYKPRFYTSPFRDYNKYLGSDSRDSIIYIYIIYIYIYNLDIYICREEHQKLLHQNLIIPGVINSLQRRVVKWNVLGKWGSWNPSLKVPILTVPETSLLLKIAG